MNHTYAILNQGGFVENIIVAQNMDVIAKQYPGAIEIDSIDPMPGIGWEYFKGVFTPPANQ